MSIVACVKVQDGIVLGCDSATQILGRDPKGNISVLKVYQNARKLFRFQELPVAILTYGMGNIGPKSVRTVLREFAGTYQPDQVYAVQKIADELSQYLNGIHQEEYKDLTPDQRPKLGIFMAGYSHSKSLGEEWEFIIPECIEPKLVRPKNKFGAAWRGVAIPFTRLYFGYDPRIKKDLETVDVNLEKINHICEKYQTHVIYDGMPVKDAVNFVKFILRTTIDFASFEIGPQSCSEPIQIAVIDEKEFKWVIKPTLN